MHGFENFAGLVFDMQVTITVDVPDSQYYNWAGLRAREETPEKRAKAFTQVIANLIGKHLADHLTFRGYRITIT